jgi:hypothetical protein
MPVIMDWETVLHLTRNACCACDGCTACQHECRLPAEQAQARHQHTRAVGNHLLGDPLDETKAKKCLRCDSYFDPRRIHRCASAVLRNSRRDHRLRRIPSMRRVA